MEPNNVGNLLQPPIFPCHQAELTSIELLDKEDREKISVDLIKRILVSEYGERLAHYALNRYGILSNPTILDFKKLLVNIAAYVRREDLEELFHAIRKGRKCHLTEAEKNIILRAGIFDELEYGQYKLLLKHYQSPIHDFIETSMYNGIKQNNEKWAQHVAMLNSFDFLQVFQGYCRNDPVNTAKWSSLEYLSRAVYLPDPRNMTADEIIGTLVPILDSHAKTHFFEIRSVTHEENLAFYILTPLSVCAGTYPVITLFRDLENRKLPFTCWETDSRAELFTKAEKTITKCLIDCVPKEKNYSLMCVGYSLASIDAQLLVASIVHTRKEENHRYRIEEKYKKENPPLFEKLSELTLAVWDPEVVSSAINTRYVKERTHLNGYVATNEQTKETYIFGQDPLTIKNHFAFWAQSFTPPYHGGWLGLREVNNQALTGTEVIQVSLIDTRTSYDPSLPDPRFSLALITPSQIDPLNLEQLQHQKGWVWTAMKSPTAISRTYFKSLKPSVVTCASVSAAVTQWLISERFGMAKVVGRTIVPSQFNPTDDIDSKAIIRNIARNHLPSTSVQSLEMLEITDESEATMNGVILYPLNWDKNDNSQCIIFNQGNTITLPQILEKGVEVESVPFQLLRLMKCPVIMFDYYGTGINQRHSPYVAMPSVNTISKDGTIVLNYAMKRFNKVVVWGSSLGGGVATVACEEYLTRHPDHVNRITLYNHDSFTTTGKIVLPSYLNCVATLAGGNLDAETPMQSLVKRGLKIVVLSQQYDPIIPEGSRMAEIVPNLKKSHSQRISLITCTEEAHAVLTKKMLEKLKIELEVEKRVEETIKNIRKE